MTDNIVAESRSIARLRTGQRVQSRYGVPAHIISELLGLSEASYRSRLRKLGLPADIPVVNFDLHRDAGEIMRKIQAELARLAQDSGLPDKGAADALTALARTVKTVIELLRENEPAPVDPVSEDNGIDVKKLRIALQRAERRIEELAQKRANELLDQRTEPGPHNDCQSGVAVSGA